MHFQLLLLFACGGDEEVQMLPTNSLSCIASPGGTDPRARRSSAGYPGTDSAGDGQWSGQCWSSSLERAVLEMITGHWGGQCWRGLSLVSGAGNAGDYHWSGQCWRWSQEQAVLDMVTGH